MLRTDRQWCGTGCRGILNRLTVLIAAAVLSAILAVHAETAAASRDNAGSSSLAGAFVNWGAVGREHTLQAWEKWLKQEPSSVLGVDFYAQTTWDDFTKLSWVPGIWKKLNPKRNVVWSVPLTVKGTPLKEVASGAHDAEFEAAAKAISEAQPRAIIRLGWEMNQDSTAWFAKGQEADYIEAFRRVVAIFRRYSSDFKYDWCPGWGPQEIPADRTYPGDDVVDYIGLDVYDFKYQGSVEERWNTHYLKAPFGLEWQRDFAAQHGKLMSFPEWGVGNFGDNPFFIQQMHDWFVENQRNIAYAAYFDVDGMWPTQIDNEQFPLSQRLFRKLFQRAS
jgi:beta-mannanase